MTRIFYSDSMRLVLGLEQSWQSRAYEDCILDVAGDYGVRHGHHKLCPVQSKYVARMVESKKESVPSNRNGIWAEFNSLDKSIEADPKYIEPYPMLNFPGSKAAEFWMKNERKNSCSRARCSGGGLLMTQNPLNSLLEANKFDGTNYLNWLRNLRIVLNFENQTYVLDKSLAWTLPEGFLPGEPLTFEKFTQWYEDNRKVQSIVLGSMSNEIQKQYERYEDVWSIMHCMKELYVVPDRHIRYAVMKAFFLVRE
ncbi:UNVERIFIED_CONTAM: hypothetical protein Scaly_2899000 [Sesamum calycinum]|uniref:Uncharacterized protein n=1 Tax=Sesamum calycinum TaxID=2727403 RepID=A0AAW2L738_9LAMI